MKRIIFFFCLLFLLIHGHVSVFAQVPVVSTGTIIRVDSFHSSYVTARNIDIWLPPGYSENEKYDVLYMHDGQMLFDSTINWNHSEWQVDETASRLISSNKIRPCIVVGIWNSGLLRHSDYCPQKPIQGFTPAEKDSFYNSTRVTANRVFSDTVYSDKYLLFLTEELKPYIDNHFSVYTDPAHTMIAGSSMGGLISLYAICEYPNVFGAAACLSTHWPGVFATLNNPFPEAMMHYLETHVPDPETHRIYFDHGTATLDSLYGAYQPLADRIFTKSGYTKNNRLSLVFPGENHSEKAWAARLEYPLIFLLGK